MNSIIVKITTVILSILLLTYIGFQVYNALYNPYETETVKQGTYAKNVELKGFFVRDETVLLEQKTGVINYKYNNGEKIPKQAVIADIYDRESDIYNIKKVERLKQEKTVFQNLQNSQTVEGSKVDLITNQVNLNLLELVKQVENGDLSTISKTKDDLTYNLNKIELSVNNTLNFDQQIADIDAEIQNTTANISPANAPITSTESGYFSNVVDGYEEAFTFDMLDKLTVDDVEMMINNTEVFAPNNIGKLQLESDWYFVALIDNKHAEALKAGQSISLTFSSKTTKAINVEIEEIISQQGKDQSVIILYSNYIDEDLMSMRFEKPQANLGDYTGVVVPKEAIRIADTEKVVIDEITKEETVVKKQVKGVYTLLGKTVRFKELDPIFEDNYVVISKQSINTNYVSVYDKVIIKGKDLNESK